MNNKQQQFFPSNTIVMVVFENTSGIFFSFLSILFVNSKKSLTSESVKSTSLSLKSVDDVHSRNGLSASVFGVGDGVSDDVLEEHLEDTTGLLIDESRDTFHTTTTSETSDGGLGDSLDIVTKNFSVTFGTSLSESFSSFSSSRHFK